MTTFIISIIVLGLIIVLMNEYGWADLTGKTRNDLVFETRNKAYGAYEIREKYSNRLLISFIGMLGFISIAAVSPKIFMNSKSPIENKSNNDNPVITQSIEKQEKKEEKKEEVIENKEKKVEPPKGAASQALVKPIPTHDLQKVDSTKITKAIISNITSVGDTSSTTNLKVVLNGGNGNNPCIDCDKDTTEYTEAGVDKKAEFDYMKYISKNLHIPSNLSEMGVKTGKIHISFVVDENGNVSSASIKRGVYPELDNEARRVVSNMPKWQPAIKNGKPVKVRMIVPIKIVVE
jgi:protein TonB